jgi:hypothetical protein
MNIVKYLLIIKLFLLMLAFQVNPVSAEVSTEIRKITPRIGCLLTYEDSELHSTALVRYITINSEKNPIRFLLFKKWIELFTERGKQRRVKQVKRCRRQGRTGWGGGGTGQPGPGNPGGGNLGEGGGKTGINACDVVGDLNNTSAGQFNFRIINGIICNIGNSPIVELIINVGDQPRAICSGTVVSSRAVVFAAHCLPELGSIPNSVTIIPGGNASLAITTSNIDYNRAYDFIQDGIPGNDDIAIAIAEVDIPTRAFKILTNNNIKVGEKAIIAGYGNKDSSFNPGTDSGSRDGNLRAGLMKISTVTTEEVIANFNFSDNKTPGKNSTTCIGDSGGPLLVKRGEEWLLAAVTSYGGQRCGPTDRAGFSNITDPANQAFLAQYLHE